MLDEFVATGRIADVALLVLAMEGAVLLAIRRRTARGPRVAAVLWNAGAGAGLLLALRAALTGAGSLPIAAALALSLVCHVGETIGRWRDVPRQTQPGTPNGMSG